MSNSIQSFYVLHGSNSCVVLDCREGVPAIIYWGKALTSQSTPDMVARLLMRQEAPASLPREPKLGLSPGPGSGFTGAPGFQAHRSGRDWGTLTELEGVEADDSRILLRSRCSATQVQVTHGLFLDHESDVLRASTTLTNLADQALSVERCNAPCIPLPRHYDRILAFEGRWALEFQKQSIGRFAGTYLRENRKGRTSHDTFPGVVLHTGHTRENSGGAYGLHLGWSGNHRVAVESFSSGLACAQLGELLHPGELSLAPGESYVSPDLYGSYSDEGFSGLSRNFHRFVRAQLTDERRRKRGKPVHFNTWEAMYFDVSVDGLSRLADEAAEVGVERFVLDDGWFRGRHADDAGLGDWYVDTDKFPDGLSPIIDLVRERGMEFGLWIEPEMVNPNSELYRAHPDWVLNADPAPRLEARNQLALDLSRQEVTDFLFDRIHELLSTYEIAYLKWDMNRDLHQPGNRDGRVSVHQQTLAVYGLLERLRMAHPEVDIESCSSGGARADFGILRYTDRVWPSDTNDAMDRLSVQRGFSLFFPPEYMGSHVGPYECHITGRRFTMATRAGAALFGDFGIEANLLEMSADEKEELKAAVALHKKHRALLHGGDLYRLDLASGEDGFGVVAPTGKEALFSYALICSQPQAMPGRYRFMGLGPKEQYVIKVVWPPKPGNFSGSALAELSGEKFSGELLMSEGVQLPIVRPSTVLVFHLQKA